VLGELTKIQKAVDDNKKAAGGQLSAEFIGKINDQIVKVEGKTLRNVKASQDLCATVDESQQKVSLHDLENKLDRRGEELRELDKIMEDIKTDNEDLIANMTEEIESCKGNSTMD